MIVWESCYTLFRIMHQGASSIRHLMADAGPDCLRAAVFYGVMLGAAAVPERIRRGSPSKLSVVLSADEVVQFLGAVPSLKSRAALTTAYAAGFRASEAAGQRIEDIDSARGVIHVLGT
jgi:integrase